MRKIFVIALLIGGSMTLVAQQKEDMNLKGERARIKEGKKSGEITHREMKRVHKEKHDVKEAIHDAKQDGVVTPTERKEIAKEDRQLDKTIHRVKHNDRRRK